MKTNNILKIFGLAAVLGVAGYNVNLALNADRNSDEVSLANNEALAHGENSPSNTGPGEVVDCAGWGTGSKKVCLSTNSNPCTETGCF
ncbi:MAG: NVEALA domain-containing protein [Dysgonamonadaceae bacterium]|jgi:hypothetical protein|nr:NVEALA domain-containing protein [Dysgonamonadaceae bacterium]